MKLFALIPFALFALPQNPEVVHGSVQFDGATKNELNIAATDRSIIHWDSFSIDPQETVTFTQPTIGSAILNRVIGSEISHLLGTLNGNSRIYLINENGVLIGADAVIDTKGLLISSLNLENEAFIHSSEFLFSGDKMGRIENLGKIICSDGEAFLLGYQVFNQGEINAQKSFAAAGKEILLKPSGDERIFIRVKADGISGDTGLEQNGIVRCSQMEWKSDGTLYEKAIQLKGEVDALGTELVDGKIFLRAEKGTVFVDGNIKAKNFNDEGGRIEILGEKVALLENAFVDLSGKFGGGTLLMGGDTQGANSQILNAEFTYVDPKAQITVQALEKGPGGKAIFWADHSTRFYGKVDASAGPLGGDGGFIEVSGKKGFDYQGSALRSAPLGQAGTLLLDPESDITIQAAGGVTGGAFSGGIFTPTAAASTIDLANFLAEIGAGNVTIQTTGATIPLPGGNGSITTTVDITYGPTANSLVLQANGTGTAIYIHGRLRNAGGGTGNITLNAPNGNILIGDPLFNRGQVQSDNGTVTLFGGDITLVGGNGGGGNSTIVRGGSGGTFVTARGNLVMSAAPLSAIEIGDTFTTSFPTHVTVGGNLTATSGPTIASIIRSTGTVELNVGGSASFSGTSVFSSGTNGGTGVSANIGRNLTLQGVGPAFSTITTSSNTSLDLTVNVGGNITTAGGPGGAAGFGAGGNLFVKAGGSMDFQESSLVTLSNLTNTPKNVTLIAGRDISFNSYAFADINNLTPGNITIVVDNDFPNPPGIGPGRFSLMGSGINYKGQVRIFTSRQAQNTIVAGFLDLNTLVQTFFSPGPLYQNSNQEQWGVYYPSSFFGGPAFTFFYKDLPVIVNFLAEPIFVAGAEMFRDLHPYDEYIVWFMKFAEINHVDPEMWAKQPFILSRKTFKDHRIDLTERDIP
ncbi:MAG: filamentous hemagglutinin N-terminal domain-containing protein [Parachlamydiales bacterium]|nr:filamentous hemagglutinin N-terminal domain-containing protein [Parachlamydiales bacterium]